MPEGVEGPLVPYEFLAGIVVGMLVLLLILSLAAAVQFVIDWTGGRTMWPKDSDLIDGVVDDE